MDTNLIIKDS